MSPSSHFLPLWFCEEVFCCSPGNTKWLPSHISYTYVCTVLLRRLKLFSHFSGIGISSTGNMLAVPALYSQSSSIPQTPALLVTWVHPYSCTCRKSPHILVSQAGKLNSLSVGLMWSKTAINGTQQQSQAY